MDGVSNDSVAKVVECDKVILAHQARVPEDKSETLQDAVICDLTQHIHKQQHELKIAGQ